MDIKLKKLDMSKSDKHEHPDIKTDNETQYLIAKTDARGKISYYSGYFNRVWFGLSFDGWVAPLQFDAPGTNSSSWVQIWEILT